jgi:hypothetical protein
MSYPAVTFLIYMGLIIRAAFVSKNMVSTVEVMAGSWLVAMIAVSIFCSVTNKNGAYAWYMFGIPSFIVPAVAGSIHARFTKRSANPSTGAEKP